MSERSITSDSLGSRIISGIAWKAGSQITLQLARMVVALLLARMLTPHDWGLAAMVLVFAGFVVVFTDSALGTALIQRREITEDDRSTVFFVSTGIGILLAIAGIACSGPLASFYGEPEVQIALRRRLDRIPRQRSRCDADGPARPRDGVQAPRASGRSPRRSSAPASGSASRSAASERGRSWVSCSGRR